ncbi:peptidoglycan recognition protein family protein [Halalkalibacter hemicellulosilyticus]|uniref:Autolysin n=1 Tax=Halalkalibacter hemicellulosilyticusJCM 9152 TaxID=1236971 RepID=W4QE17_9BACI|nr:N-acetylmuramoyl-L-alanine amidase [Halalkalibacter hemicellulosilyticus]GAE29903.1 peptidoglycan-binding domain 1 [Halalkalibacter hemicellulosilyticusJCM 9152]
MKIVDKRNALLRSQTSSYRRRPRSTIRNIAIHHSATTSGSAEAFARYHVNELGWPGIGYHYVVDRNGQISHCHDIEVVSYHVGNSNRYAIGICMVGDFRTQTLTKEQRQATLRLTRKLMDDLAISVDNVWGHDEFPGYAWKPCPSINMQNFRNRLTRRGGSYEEIEVDKSFTNDQQQRTILSIGDQGSDVKEIQQRLDELGFNPGPLDGIYGSQTEDAVIRFQRTAAIKVDGVVGPQTREQLDRFEHKDERELASPTDEPDENSTMYEEESRRLLRLLRPMMRGEDVREVQEKVGAVPDGLYGPETERRVQAFQRDQNILVDGIVGPQTWRALDRISENGVGYERLLSIQSPYMRGQDIRRVQRELGITADGLFGPQTETAVRDFQRAEGITVDGIVGPQTWARLFQ